MKRNMIWKKFLAGSLSVLLTAAPLTHVTYAAEESTVSVIQVDDTSEESEAEAVVESETESMEDVEEFIDEAEAEESLPDEADSVATEETESIEDDLLEIEETETVGENPYDESISSANFYVVDQNGSPVHSYVKNGREYLFLPNSMDLQNVTIISKYEISTADKGTVEASNHAITVDASPESMTLAITYADGSKKQLNLMHSELPSIQITLNGTTLNYIHSHGKDAKYAGNTVSISDPSDPSNNLLRENSVELKGRGNTTWKDYGDKKPYQIKFSKKESVLGMNASKKWVLLANACDGSLLKNATVFNAVNQMGFEYSVKMQSVDLWIDGSYRGNYFLSEKVEFDKARLNLENGSILSEMDNVYYNSETNFRDELGQYMTLKDPDLEDKGVSEDWKVFQSKWNAFESELKKQTWQSWDQIEMMIDVESFAKWYLVSEFFSNQETDSTSCYFYYNADDGKIYAGPLWDFDSSMNSCHTPSEQYYLAKNHAIYSRLLSYSSFAEEVVSQYNSYRSVLANSVNYMRDASDRSATSIEMNYIRWDTLGGYIVKGIYLEKTYGENLNASLNWLRNREAIFTPYIPVSGRGQIVCQNTYSDKTEMYRLLNKKSGEHFYTGKVIEANYLIASNHGWEYEGIAWYAPKKSNTPVYRLYSPKSGEHLYTADANERRVLLKIGGWNDEGIGWYSDDEKGVPIYRLFNSRARRFNHHYTKDANERSVLLRQNWNNEGIGWYGMA